jgi:hypothetical protein
VGRKNEVKGRCATFGSNDARRIDRAGRGDNDTLWIKEPENNDLSVEFSPRKAKIARDEDMQDFYEPSKLPGFELDHNNTPKKVKAYSCHV